MTLSPALKARVIRGLPLPEVPKIAWNQYINFPDTPCVLYAFISEGARVHFYRDLLRSHRNVSGEWNDWYGQLARATLSLTIISFDPLEVQDLAHRMTLELWRCRLGLVKGEDRVWMTRLIRSTELPAIRSELHKRLLHRWNIEIELEYELSWLEVVPAIRSVDLDLDGLEFQILAPECYNASILIVKR